MLFCSQRLQAAAGPRSRAAALTDGRPNALESGREHPKRHVVPLATGLTRPVRPISVVVSIVGSASSRKA